MPESQFNAPPLFGPPPGLTPDEIDAADEFRRNADHSNESRNKLQSLLEYLLTFNETVITDLNGLRQMILSKPLGSREGNIGGCLRPRFTTNEANQIVAFWYQAFLLFPHGEERALIPLPPKFQDKYLDDQGDDPAKDNSMVLADGGYAAFLKIDGYNAELLIQDADDDPPAGGGEIGDVVVWRLATWTVEDTGTDEVQTTEEEFYSCPFLPFIEEPAAHPFFPFLYRKVNEIKGATGGWFAKVSRGLVHDVHTGNYFTCNDADGVTEIEVSAGQTWWVELKTDSDGGPYRVSLLNSEPTHQVFQQPHDPSVTSGQEGNYKWKAFEIEAVGDRLVPRIYLGKNIDWFRVLVKNIGSGDGRVYKQFNVDDKYHELRTLVGQGDITVSTMGDEVIIENCCSI